jgi:flagellar hook-associated protein FlgK
MQQLEKKIYIFSVEAIGWSKSMEKNDDQPEDAVSFKLAAANAYKFFSDAVGSEENSAFANKLRDSLTAAKEAQKIVNRISSDDQELEKQRSNLNQQIATIVNELEEIIKKIIY